MATTTICFGWLAGNTLCSIAMAMACYRGSVRNSHRRCDNRRLPSHTEAYGDYGFSQACGNRKDAELWSRLAAFADRNRSLLCRFAFRIRRILLARSCLRRIETVLPNGNGNADIESSLHVASRNHTGEVLWLFLDRDLFNVAGGRNRGTYLGCVVSAERQPRSWMD